MAFNKRPDVWMPSWSENGTLITVPIATFEELTDAEADGATGDIRKIAWAIIEDWYQTYNALATADRPTKWTMYKSTSTNTTTNVATNTFTISFLTEVTGQEVVDE